MTLSAGPTLTSTALRLEGIATLLGCANRRIDAVFTVSADTRLELTLTVTPPDDWRLSDTFPDLAGTLWEGVELRTPALWFTTVAHDEAGVFFTLAPGVSVAGTLLITPELTWVASATSPDAAQRIAVGGSVTRGSTGTSLTWAAHGGV